MADQKPDRQDDICAACGAARREHTTPGGTRYGPQSLCSLFIPQSTTAPPKSAPDAMREALVEKEAQRRCTEESEHTLEYLACQDRRFRHDDRRPWWKAYHEPIIRSEMERLEKAGFSLSAPVPPADQTQQSGLYQGEPRCFYPGCGCGDLRACYPDRVAPPIREDRQVAWIADEICKDPRIFTRDWNHSLEGLKAVIIEHLSFSVQPAIEPEKR